MPEHDLFTTWSGTPGRPDTWCITCSINTGKTVSWEDCQQIREETENE